MMDYREIIQEINKNISKVIIGKERAVKLLTTALIAGGHMLIEDVPGIGKTSIASALAKSIGASFKRIQFTPDVLPTDITGFSAYNRKTDQFEYIKGAVMSNIVLADEINRTSPKTQASMLEVMEEYQVTVDGCTYEVPLPFMVLATQNPVEYIGTYPLPEAQMDRFLIKISLGYPSRSEEMSILEQYRESKPLSNLQSVVTAEQILEMQNTARKVNIVKALSGYIVDIVSQTRVNEDVELGCSPRASIYLQKAAQAYALINGRDYVIPDDIKILSVPVLSHRLILTQDAKFKNISPESVILSVLDKIDVPKKLHVR